MPGELTQLIEKVVTSDPVARKVSRSARIDERLGTVASGIFNDPGAISSIYLDHGTGQNLLNYNDVDWSGYPRDTFWYYNDVQRTEADLINQDEELDADVIRLYSPAQTYTAWIPITQPSQTHNAGTQYLASIYFFGDNFPSEGADVQLRVRGFDTKANALAGTFPQETFTATASFIDLGQRIRMALPFTPTALSAYLRFEIRAKRNDTAVGTNIPTASAYMPMLEEITEGQTRPSKFTLPIPRRGGLPVSLLEGNAFRTYISGMEISRESNSSISVSAGQCFIPGRSQLISSSSPTVVSFTPGTGPFVRYVYAGVDSNGDFEITIGTAVPVLYAGTARVQTGDDQKRFIGTIVVYDNKVPQHKRESDYFYFTDGVESLNGGTGLPWRQVLTAGASTGGTVVSLAGLVPAHVNSVDLMLRLRQPGGTGQTFTTARVGHPALPGNLGAAISAGLGESVLYLQVGPQANAVTQLSGVARTDNSASQNVNYAVSSPTSPTATLDINLMGWYEQR